MSDILFLAHRVPFPPNRGDKIRSAHLLKKLAQIAPVHVGCFSENAEDRAAQSDVDAIAKTSCIPARTKPLVLAGAEAVWSGKPVSLTAFHSNRLQRWVRETIAAHRIETLVIFSGQMGRYVPDDFAGRVVIDLCDVDSAKFESYAEAGERVWLNAREGRLLRAEEARLAQRADATVLISDNEAELFRSRLDKPERARIHVIGNGIDARFFDPAIVHPHAELTHQTGPHFVFTGQMDYRPNVQAALWVIDHFMPAIRETHGNAMFHIVGRNPAPALTAHNNTPGVRVWGEVPDVRPFIAAADCVLAPLQIARGVQNKVLEAMAMARTVMLTPEAATGIAAQDGKHWLLEQADAAQMAQRFCELTDAQAPGNKARQFVLDNHDWETVLAPLGELVKPEAETRDAA